MVGTGARRGVQRAVVMGAVAVTAHCTAYNECKQTKGDIIGYTAIELDLRGASVRFREMPIGNLVADSFFEVAMDNCGGGTGVPCPDIAVENAGAIRTLSEAGCDQRDSIAQGPILNTDLEGMLPFAVNHLVQVEVTGQDLRLLLEHAVDRLGEGNTADTSGWFLQVSHLRFSVDCSGAKYLLNAEGTQVISVGSRIRSAEIRRDSTGGTTWEAVDLNDGTRVYQVITNDFTGGAHDGHLGFARRDATNHAVMNGTRITPLPQRDLTDQGATYNDGHAVKRYIGRRNDRGQNVAPLVEGRINLDASCFQRVQG